MVKKKPIDFEIDKKGCFICNSHHVNKHGYAVMSLNNKKTLIHRFIYQEMFEEIKQGMIVRHKCDNPTCINPEHLELGTQFDNVQDRVKRGRGTKGEKVPISVLTTEKVREIKRSFGISTHEKIAKTFGVSITAIGDIYRGKTWKHVE